MSTSTSSHEQAARRAALRQTLESAMDVLDLKESQQQQQQFPSSTMGLPLDLSLGNANHQNSALSRASLHSTLPSSGSIKSFKNSNFGSSGQLQYASGAGNNNSNNGCNSHNALFSSVTAEDRLLAQARSAFIQERLTSDAQKQCMIANFLQQSKHQEQQQQHQGPAYGSGPAQGSSENSTTSVLQALMGNMSGTGFPKPYASTQTSPSANVFSSAAYQQQRHHQQLQQNQVQVPITAPQKNDTAILHVLGSNLRDKSRVYVDVSVMPDPEEETEQRHFRGGVAEPFPEKLHRMLLEADASGRGDIVSFFSHGRGFGIHDPEKFVEEILPEYFKQSKLNSFLRQLNLYGFVRTLSGPDSGGCYHELFLKDRPRFSRYMRRVGVPVKGEDRRKSKNAAIQLGPEPDFYEMTPVRRG
jgi:hypothetical protein